MGGDYFYLKKKLQHVRIHASAIEWPLQYIRLNASYGVEVS